MKNNIHIKRFNLLLLLVIFLNCVQYSKAQVISLSKEVISLQSDSISSLPKVIALPKTSSVSTVGSTLAEFSVSTSGSATYSIPFMVPQGINNFVPNIGLAYNSQSGNGIAGWGWNISGLSAISRVSTTNFHDGYLDPVDLDNNDRYTLDGQRLMLSSGTYGASNSEYQTENYSNLKVTAQGSNSESGPSSFVVYYPDGSKAFYGYWDNGGSGAINQGARNYLQWALFKKQDPLGNFIEYKYINEENKLYIDAIEYGSRESTTHPNKINFHYKSRERNESLFIGGNSIITSKVLDYIEIKGNNELYRKYEISYDITTLGYERVAKITEYNGSNESLTPIEFTYNESLIGSADLHQNESQTSIFDYEKDNVFGGDFNGDGNADLGIFEIDGNGFSLFNNLSKNTSAYNKNTSESVKHAFASNLLSSNQISQKQTITTISDLSDSEASFKTYRYDSNNTVNIITEKIVDLPYYTSEWCSKTEKHKPFQYISGDFNGDGITDVMALGKNYTYRTKKTVNVIGCESSVSSAQYKEVYFIDLKEGTTNSSSPIGSLVRYIKEEDIIRTGDFNGDGKTDIYHFGNGYVYIYTLSSDNQLIRLGSKLDGDISIEHRVLIGDFNGDGKTDFTVPLTNNSSKWNFFIARGDIEGFTKNIRNTEIIFKEDYKVDGSDSNSAGIIDPIYNFSFISQDFNGDGKTDILRYLTINSDSDSKTHQKIEIFPNTNNIYFKKRSFTDITNSTAIKKYGVPLVLDFNYTNYNPEFIFLNEKAIATYSFPKNHQSEITMNTIKNNQISINIDYQRLGVPDENEGEVPIYQSGNSQFYPYVNINIAPNIKLVESVTKKSGNIFQKQDYEYAKAVSHTQGFGFLGFKTIKRTNWYGDQVGQLWNISNHDPQKRGALTKQWLSVSSSTSSSYINKTEYTYTTSLAANKVYTILPTSILNHDNLQGVSSTQAFTYDAYNNPLTATNSFSGGSKIKTITYSNNTSTSSYHIGRPTYIIESNTLNGETFSNESEIIYNGNEIEKIIKKGNGNTDSITEEFEYDDYGNVESSTISAPGVTSRTNSFTYDSSGRFVKTKTDPHGFITEYDYNYANGSVISIKSPYNLTSTFNYDGWGRMISETDYKMKSNTYSYTTTIENDNWAVAETKNFADGGHEISYYNAFGWLIKNKVKTLGENKYVFKSYEYDEIGRIRKESEPYFSSPLQWNQTGYDNYGRVISQELFTGKTINTSYNELTVAIDDGTKTKILTKNAVGNITKVIDPGGTINYTYFANGNIKQVDYGTHVVTTEIDGWGRKTRLIDPSAGIYTYEHNNYGELKKETTPKGITTYNYDAFGKITSKTIKGSLTDLSLTYNYNSSKLLDNIIGTDHITNKQYTYDYDYDSTSKLIKSIKEITPTASFEKKLIYDDLNRVESEEYINNHTLSGTTSTIHVQNIFDSAGILKEIIDKNTEASLWKLTEETARGQAKKINLGNGIIKERVYNNYGFLENINDTKTSVSALNIDYDFDVKRGILNNRENFAFGGWQESFTHDQLNRLNNISGATTRVQRYDNQGRIEANTKLGEYAYNTSKIYQLDKIDLNTNGEAYYNDNPLQEIAYNAFKKPVTIYQESKGRVDFEYGPLQNRTYAHYGGLQTNKTERQFQKQYSSITPVEILEDKTSNTVKIVTYISGDAYSAPIAHIKKTGANTIDEYHYLHRDYLGSILAITDSNGTVKERRQFGAWGAVDKFIDASGNTNFSYNSLLGRGYTGHEHFFEVGLIHMNGRMYNATLGRFLSPDNYIYDTFDSQSFNRFSYVLNNPLMYIDPSGEDPLTFILGSLAVAAVSYLSGAHHNRDPDTNKWNWDISTWSNGGYVGLGGTGTLENNGSFTASVNAVIAPPGSNTILPIGPGISVSNSGVDTWYTPGGTEYTPTKGHLFSDNFGFEKGNFRSDNTLSGVGYNFSNKSRNGVMDIDGEAYLLKLTSNNKYKFNDKNIVEGGGDIKFGSVDGEFRWGRYDNGGAAGGGGLGVYGAKADIYAKGTTDNRWFFGSLKAKVGGTFLSLHRGASFKVSRDKEGTYHFNGLIHYGEIFGGKIALDFSFRPKN